MKSFNTLGLDDDVDSVELLLAIERVFDIRISDQDASRVRTMGDLQDLVASRFDEGGGEKCRTSMAFYRVRRALRAVLGAVEIRPDSNVRDLWSRSPKSLFVQTQRHCDLQLASLSQTHVSSVGMLLIAAATIPAPLLLLAKISGWLVFSLAIAIVAAGFTLIRLDPLAYAPKMATVGDIARQTANRNYGALVKLGGRSNDQAIWDTLVSVANDYANQTPTGLPPETIDHTTILLQSQFDKEKDRPAQGRP